MRTRNKDFQMFRIEIYVIILLLFISCKTGPSSMKSSSLGAPGELLVAIDPAFKDTGMKEEIDSFAEVSMPGIPQIEPTFNVSSILLPELGKQFKYYRNILIVRLSESLSDSVRYIQNLWSQNQQVVYFSVKDIDSFRKIFAEQKSKVHDFFYLGDIHTMAKELKKRENVELKGYVNSKYNLHMLIPEGYKLVRDTSDFSWFRLDNKEVIQNILIKSFSLDTMQKMDKENLMKLCDQATKTYIPGPSSATFMKIEDKFPMLFNKVVHENRNVYELRGLWKVQGYFMGGPFINYFVQDLDNKRLIMIETFVYAPQKQNKAYYIRQMESILSTLKLG